MHMTAKMAKGIPTIVLILSGTIACLAVALLITGICLFRLSSVMDRSDIRGVRSAFHDFQNEVKTMEHQLGRYGGRATVARRFASRQGLLNDSMMAELILKKLNMTALPTDSLSKKQLARAKQRDYLLTYLMTKQKEIRHTIMGFLCGAPWKKIHDAMCVRAFDEGKSWADARRSCRSQKAELVSIKAASQTVAIVKFLSSSPSQWFWIGLHGQAEHKYYYWSKDYETLVYQHWKAREPGHSGNCVNMDSRDGRWDNDLCGARLPYICQKHFFKL